MRYNSSAKIWPRVCFCLFLPCPVTSCAEQSVSRLTAQPADVGVSRGVFAAQHRVDVPDGNVEVQVQRQGVRPFAGQSCNEIPNQQTGIGLGSKIRLIAGKPFFQFCGVQQFFRLGVEAFVVTLDDTNGRCTESKVGIYRDRAAKESFCTLRWRPLASNHRRRLRDGRRTGSTEIHSSGVLPIMRRNRLKFFSTPFEFSWMKATRCM